MPVDRPPWDDERAQQILGARVLIGATYVGVKGTRQEQMFGTVVSVDRELGFEVALEGSRAGERFWVPPQAESFQAASPGTYRLRSTGEVVVDPDYTTTWTINEKTTH